MSFEILNALNLCQIVNFMTGGTIPNHLGLGGGKKPLEVTQRKMIEINIHNSACRALPVSVKYHHLEYYIGRS